MALAGCAETPVPDLAEAVQNTPGAALVVYDVAADSVTVSVRGDSLLPAVGVTALVTALAAESLTPEARSVRLPASLLRPRRLPGLEPERADTAVWTLGALLDAALRGDRAAADEALDQVGRARVEAAAPEGVEAPLPVGGLMLAWAPERRGDARPRAARAAVFRSLAPEARRDSAFARDRAFLNSRVTRADETMRLEREGLGLDDSTTHALALATLPRASAVALARLAAQDALRARLLALGETSEAPARTAVAALRRIGAALSVAPSGDRVGVLIWCSDLGIAAPERALADAVARPKPEAIPSE